MVIVSLTSCICSRYRALMFSESGRARVAPWEQPRPPSAQAGRALGRGRLSSLLTDDGGQEWRFRQNGGVMGRNRGHARRTYGTRARPRRWQGAAPDALATPRCCTADRGAPSYRKQGRSERAGRSPGLCSGRPAQRSGPRRSHQRHRPIAIYRAHGQPQSCNLQRRHPPRRRCSRRPQQCRQQCFRPLCCRHSVRPIS